MVGSSVRWRRVALAAAAVAGTLGAAVGPAAARTLYVSPHGHDVPSCAKPHPCKTIEFAVGNARRGDTVRVAKGSYRESLTITRGITLRGIGRPVINALGANGILITGAKSARTTVVGFVVENAKQEGILAERTSHVTIAFNRVLYNDKGAQAAHPTGECAPSGAVPGDCGQGIHLESVNSSTVSYNTVTHNLGGILLTDELGPTARNKVMLNAVSANPQDGGITLAGRNAAAVSSGGRLQPSIAGVHGNQITHNVLVRNGTKGRGAGILLVEAVPGAAADGNTIANNTATGNGIGGVTLHADVAGPGLDANKIIGNSLSRNGILGDPDAGVGKTTGITIFSAATRLKGIVVRGNHISREHFGIWTRHVPKIKRSANVFGPGVAVDLVQK